MLVQEFLKNWLDTYGKHNLKLSTYTGYERHIENYIIPAIGNMNITDIKPIHIQNMYYDLIDNGRVKSDKPLNNKTVLQTHRILHKALSNAVNLEILKYNPADNIDLPRKKKYEYNIILNSDLKKFIESFRGTNLYEAVYLALHLGLRRGELLALQFKDLDIKTRILTINKNLVYSNRIVKIDTVKTDKSNRQLLLSKDLVTFIQNIRNERKSSLHDYIIVNTKGELYNPGSFSRQYTYLRDKLKLDKVRFHDLRHIHATILYQSGIPIKLIQERLGHSNISTTIDIYTHLFIEDQIQVLNVIDNIIE